MTTPTQHIESIILWLDRVMTRKYHRGQQEHGGSLWMKPGAMKNLEEELLDEGFFEEELLEEVFFDELLDELDELDEE